MIAAGSYEKMQNTMSFVRSTKRGRWQFQFSKYLVLFLMTAIVFGVLSLAEWRRLRVMYEMDCIEGAGYVSVLDVLAKAGGLI